MKKLPLLLVALMLAISFSSCSLFGDKEGEYKPKEKISRIYKDYGEGDGKKLREVWNWDKKQLQRIDHYSGGSLSWSEEFTYNKKGQIERVDCYEDGEYVEYVYDGNKMSRSTYYYNGSIEEEYTFKYDGNKVSEIEIMYFYKGERDNNRLKEEGQNPLKMLLQEENYEIIKEKLDNNMATKDFVTIKLEWNKNNVSKFDITSGADTGRYEFKYDDKLNPFKNYYDLYTFYDGDINDVLVAYSKNNVTEVRGSFNEDGETYSGIIKYSYTYDGKFPIVKRYTYTDEEYDWYEDEYNTVTITESTYYEYE